MPKRKRTRKSMRNATPSKSNKKKIKNTKRSKSYYT